MLAILAVMIIPLALTAQDTKKIFDYPGCRIIWHGVDFSQVKLNGDLGTVSPEELIPLFYKINLVIVDESFKYDFTSALQRYVPYDLGCINAINAAMDVENSLSHAHSFDKGRITPELIAEHVKQYDMEQKEGIGLVFIMESLDKPTETGTMWVTFFDPADGKVILTERMSGLAGGFGFRNHWARTVYNVINEIKIWRYEEWKRRYVKSHPANEL
jgi:hypothetical protein